MTMVDAHASSTPLYAADGVTYHVAGMEHGDAMTRLLASSFTHEPMGRALGLTAAELHEFVSRFVPECNVNGLSVIAVSARSRRRLAPRQGAAGSSPGQVVGVDEHAAASTESVSCVAGGCGPRCRRATSGSAQVSSLVR